MTQSRGNPLRARMTPEQIQQAVSGSQPANTQPPPNRDAAIAYTALFLLVLMLVIRWIIRHNPAFNRNPAAPTAGSMRPNLANPGSPLP